MPARAQKIQQSHSPLLDVRFKPLQISRSTPRRSETSPTPDVVHRIRGEFVEMRGFSPTIEQASRLFQVNRDECRRILGILVDEGFLKRTPDGRYRLPSQH